MAFMQNIKPLVNPKDKGFKGLVIFCKDCRKEIRNDLCSETGKSIKKCPHLDRHIYKYYVYIPGTNEKKTINIEDRDFEIAQGKALKFKEYIRSGSYKSLSNNLNKEEKLKKECLLTDILDKYLSWLRNEDVPAHLRKERTTDHVKDVARVFEHFKNCLRSNVTRK